MEPDPMEPDPVEPNPTTINAIIDGNHTRPYDVLGLHKTDRGWVIRTFQPHATTVAVHIDGAIVSMEKVDPRGLFTLACASHPGFYYLQLSMNEYTWDVNEPYQFESSIGELDQYLFNSGSHNNLYDVLGAKCITHQQHTGVRFVVWAPNASLVSIISNFNDWDPRRHVMRKHEGCGLWEIFVPDIGAGTLYKFSIKDSAGMTLPLKSDPFGRYAESPPGNASVVFESEYQWQDSDWQNRRTASPDLSAPVSIYEVHAGSWKWKDGQILNYRELANSLIPYVLDIGYTHIEFLPLNEHPFTGSWGYQPTGLYAPTQRFGDPDDFRFLVDQCHLSGIGVIVDWVPAHFPNDAHGLGHFDGTHLYEHADPRQGLHQDWNTLIYNYGRTEVANFLIANAVFWIREFHLDGLRVDAVASMLYLDYSREDGQWIPNSEGGNQNLEAIALLQRINEQVHAEKAMTLAEESTSYDGVSRPVYDNGLGFTYKWNMGWMHDVLDYMSTDPMYRKYHHQQLTFGMMYAHSENFTLPFSHDEVVHGKGSMLTKMSGDPWQARANLKCCYAFMFAYPGKKLNFMGGEFGQIREWSHDRELDWHLLEDPDHASLLSFTKRLNTVYKDIPALHKADFDSDGFRWVDCEDKDQSVLSWYRHAKGHGSVMIVCNLTPVVRHKYKIGVDTTGIYRTLLNSDDHVFGGTGISSNGQWQSKPEPLHGREHSIELDLPPLGVLYLLK